MDSDYYQLLGLSRSATNDDIRRAYRRMAKRNHPDKGGNAEHFKLIKTAYDVLRRTTSRRDYDSNLPLVYQAPPQPKATEPVYDPFSDPDYHRRAFFQPKIKKLEGFERSERARGCPICSGSGILRKSMSHDPRQAFASLEERYCQCQLL